MTSVDPASLADTPLLAAIAWSYLVINAARIVTYVPQIVAAWRCKDGARAISLLTWSSWAVSHLSGLAYGTLVLHDAFFVVITSINLLGCTSVTAIVAMHRWRLRHDGPSVATASQPPTTKGHAPMATLRAIPLLAAACAGALAAALWLPARWQPAPPKATAMTALPVAALPPLDELRADASVGRPYAALDLISALLTRYETSGDQEALFEAMLVLDREWDQPQVLASDVIDRVVRKHCPTERLLRRFWLCDPGGE